MQIYMNKLLNFSISADGPAKKLHIHFDIKTERIELLMNVEIAAKYLLTIKEAAAYFRVGEKKLRALAREHGSRISVMDGNRTLIKRVAMEAFIEESEVL